MAVVVAVVCVRERECVFVCGIEGVTVWLR